PRRSDLPPKPAELLRRMMSASPGDRPPLTEVHQVLRGTLNGLSRVPGDVPSAAVRAVPELEPEPEPLPTPPGCDPALGATPTHLSRGTGRPEGPAGGSGRRRGRILAAAAAGVFVVAAAGAVVVHQQGAPSPTPIVTLPPSTAAEYRVRSVHLSAYAG